MQSRMVVLENDISTGIPSPPHPPALSVLPLHIQYVTQSDNEDNFICVALFKHTLVTRSLTE